MLMLTLPFPPALNHYYRNFRGRTVISKAGREYKIKVAEIVADGGKKIEGRLSMVVKLFAPTRRKYDLDGRLKALQDAMQDAGVFEDDEQIDEITVLRGEVEKGGRCVVVLNRMSTEAKDHVFLRVPLK